ncbi:hypothetical protein ACFQ0T_29395 [Kitasatospora gansuensis]
MYAQLAENTATFIHNPGVQARAVLNSVFVDVTPDDDRTVKIAFTPSGQPGEVRMDLTLLDARKAHLDTVTGTFLAAATSRAAPTRPSTRPSRSGTRRSPEPAQPGGRTARPPG